MSSTSGHDLKKFDGKNFPLWKLQMEDVLVQKDLLMPILGFAKKPATMADEEWKILDRKALATIRLSLAESVYFNVSDEGTAEGVWTKLQNTYEKETATNKVFLMKKLYNLKMREGSSMAEHVNAFNIVASQLSSVKMKLDDETKAILLLCSLPDSWEMLTVAIGNTAPGGTLKFEDVVSSLLNEELRRLSSDESKSGDAHHIRGRGRKATKGESSEGRSRSKSKTKGKEVKCFHCGKTGHYKRDCWQWKKEQENSDKGSEGKKGKKSKGKSEEVNSSDAEANTAHVDSDGDVLLTTSFDEVYLTTFDSDLDQAWIIDSGASFHVTPCKDWFTTYREGRSGRVFLGNNHACDIVGVGDISFAFGNGQEYVLKNVRHVPKLRKSLISTGQLDDSGHHTTFGNQSWRISKGAMTIARGRKSGTLYPLHVKSVEGGLIAVTSDRSPIELWHKRLGHMSEKGLQVLSERNRISGLKDSDLPFCEHCLFGKQKKLPFKRQSSERKKTALELVHSDVCGSMPERSIGGASYYVTFIDDATRKVWAYPIKHKDDVLKVFKDWHATVENQSGKTLRCLRTDNGGEYCSKEFNAYCRQKGIKRELTAPMNPQQNGVAERMNRTICERVRSMLSNSGLPQRFWGEAVTTAVHIINRSPSYALDSDVPEELWSGRPASYGHLKVFGCEAYVHVPKEQRGKFDLKSNKCIFMGYGDVGDMGYRLWNPLTKKIVRSRDVVFNESGLLRKEPTVEEVRRVIFKETGVTEKVGQEVRGQMVPQPGVGFPAQAVHNPLEGNRVDPLGPNQADPAGRAGEEAVQEAGHRDDLGEHPNEGQEIWIRRSTRTRRQPQRYVPSLDFVLLTDEGEPSCYDEACQREDCSQWEKAMDEEMDALVENRTWELVALPEGRVTLPNKWVYKIKQVEGSGGSEAGPKYKARLVAKGYAQKKGVDYDEIFSPVVKMTTLRAVLGLVAHEDMELEQFDVRTAFLHGDLGEEIYMSQPEGYRISGKEHLVCKLKKSLYGLKQAPRLWYQKFDTFMLGQGFRRSSSDHCLYTKKASDGSLLILVLYVDDMLFAGKNKVEMGALKAQLKATFAMKDLGNAKHILGMRIDRDRKSGSLRLSQEKYIEKVLRRFGMEGAKPLGTPLPPHVILSHRDSPKTEEERSQMSQTPYASAVGSLMYAMVATRPDISHAVGVVSRFMANPGKQHWEGVKGILRYLKGTKGQCLCYGSGKPEVSGFVDSDMAGDVDGRKSTTGYVFCLNGGAISWVSRLQQIVALSTTEAEYIAATEACKEAIWLTRLLEDLGVLGTAPILHCDSQSAIQLAKNPVFHARTKHIDIRFHYIRGVLEDGLVQLVKVRSEDNPADICTKSLPARKLEHCKALMGVR